MMNKYSNLQQKGKRLTEEEQLQFDNDCRERNYARSDVMRLIKKLQSTNLQQSSQHQANRAIRNYYALAAQAVRTMHNDPLTREEAVDRDDADEWRKAELQELKSI